MIGQIRDLLGEVGTGFVIAYGTLIVTLVLVGPLVARLLRLPKPWWFAAPAMIGVAGVMTTSWLGGLLASRYLNSEHVLLGLTVIAMITAHIALAVLVTKRAPPLPRRQAAPRPVRDSPWPQC